MMMFVQGDHRLAVQVIRGYRASLGQGALGRQSDVHAQPIESDLQFVQVVLGLDDPQIKLALCHPVADLRRAEGQQG